MRKNNTIKSSANSLSSTNNAFQKIKQFGRFSNWMDYQKWLLSYVKPIKNQK